MNSPKAALPALPERDNDELRCAVWDSLCYWRDSGSGVDALQASNQSEDMLDKLLQAYALSAIAAHEAAQAASPEAAISEYDGLPLDAMPEPDGWRYMSLQAKCRDLLHLLSFADIKTPSERDAVEATKVIAGIREFINTEGSASLAARAVAVVAESELDDPYFGVQDEVYLTRAVCVMNDVLEDIADWEDKELASAVKDSKVDLCAMIEVIRMRADSSYVPGNKPIDGEFASAPQAAREMGQ